MQIRPVNLWHTLVSDRQKYLGVVDEKELRDNIVFNGGTLEYCIKRILNGKIK